MTIPALRDALDRALRAMWPRRFQRELLLDLGERQGWGEVEHDAALDAAVNWLGPAVLLPTTLSPAPWSGIEAPLADLRSLGEALAGATTATGVARWIVGLAPALGVTPKTLANSLRCGLASQRPDHRWLRLIARVRRGEGAPDAWTFHRRSPAVLAAELARWTGTARLDAGDAVLMVSLLALWQRRRPTAEARGNRGREGSRRATPKPIAAVRGSLVAPGQLRHLAALARQLGGTAGRDLLMLAVEAALTEAHLAPHRARHTDHDHPEGGERWLRAVEAVLHTDDAVLGADDVPVVRFRLDRLRAWRDQTPQPDPPVAAVRSPYVRASLALEHARLGRPLPDAPFDPHTPGLMMLLPLLRRRDLLVMS